MTKKEKAVDCTILDTQIETLKEELNNAEQAKLRALADLENFRRREGESRSTWSSLAVSEWVKGILPSIQELLLGSEHSIDKDIQKVIKKFMDSLEKQGLEKISPITGSEINPDEHAVLMTAEGKAGTVVQVLEPGWKLGKTVILPAKISGAPLS